ncbi:unnamed protein product, partial [Ascophyllum nodosum]
AVDQCDAEVVSPVSSASRPRGVPKAQSGGHYNPLNDFRGQQPKIWLQRQQPATSVRAFGLGSGATKEGVWEKCREDARHGKMLCIDGSRTPITTSPQNSWRGSSPMV